MATSVFIWEGKTRQGNVQKGELAASNKEEVIALLRKQNILPINVSAKPKEIKFQFGGQKITDKDVVILTRQLATMIDAGLPLVQCLDILGSQTENKALAKVVGQVRSDVESGATFAEHSKDTRKYSITSMLIWLRQVKQAVYWILSYSGLLLTWKSLPKLNVK